MEARWWVVSLQAKADKMEIDLGVQTIAPVAKDSQLRNADMMSTIVAAIKAVGISDSEISTSGYNVYPNYEWHQDTGKNVINGYTTQNTIAIKTTKIDLAGALLDAAAKSGANTVNNIQFTLSTAQQDTLRTQALKQATSDSKGKAQAIADGLGVKLGDVASVSTQEVNFPIMYARGYESGMALKSDVAPAALPPIQAGDITVSATVNVVYNIA